MTLFRLLLLLGLLAGFTTDEGNGFDPHGTPRTNAVCDDGNGLDPHGGCRPANGFADRGSGIDPNG